jgi:hypothetical protein
MLAVLSSGIDVEAGSVEVTRIYGDVSFPVDAMIVDLRTEQFERVTVESIEDGALILTRLEPVSWGPDSVIADYTPYMTTARKRSVIGALRGEVFKNARI